MSQVTALMTVFDETRALFHRLKLVVEQIHAEDHMTGGLRGVLRGLLAQGPQTVPQMARARPTSRQHIQVLVNQLKQMGLVELVENPAHKRSRLVSLTTAGKQRIEAMNRRELELVEKLSVGISEKNLYAAANTLTKVRRAFESQNWFELTGNH